MSRRAIEIHVPNRLLEQSRDYGEKIVEDFQAGRNSRSRAVGVPDHPIDNNVDMQTMGRVCEVAGCLALGLDADVINWSRRPDSGYDFQYHGDFIDVKGTDHPNAQYLIWPVSKRFFFHEAPFNILMMVRALKPDDPFYGTAWVEGWITKEEFFRIKTVATYDEHRLSDGTWFVNKSRLNDMRDLIAPQPGLAFA